MLRTITEVAGRAAYARDMTAPQDPFASPPPGRDSREQRPQGPPGGQPPPSYGAPYGPPPGQPAYDAHGPGQTRTEPKAWIALGLAIIAYTGVPFLAAVVALFVAHAARRDIRASGGRLTGLEITTWAVVIAWVHLVLVALLFLFVVAAILLPFTLPLL
jgi:hypothetical protein